MEPTTRYRPVLLCILDGWGHREEADSNAIALARTPVWDRLMAECPHALLQASADHVGLPGGQMGNSEVGHTNIGAGRVVMQDLPRIDDAVAEGTLADRPALRDLTARLRDTGGACHLLGLMSPGGVHSHQDHIAALARAVAAAGVAVRVHAFLDGRDTSPKSAADCVARFEAAVADLPDVTMATLGGRYWGMDRDKRWARVEPAYDALVDGRGAHAGAAAAAIRQSYDNGVTDEFVPATVIGAYDGMRDGDGLLMANFRADRARQIVAALVDPDFDGFARARVVNFAARVGMTEYAAALAEYMTAIFPPTELRGTLGAAVADAGLTQLRIAETEKYAHVTFFLNGGRETVYPGEERVLVPSPQVATYDLQPEMSAPEVTDRLVEAIQGERFDLIVANFANADMVGHTGKLDAAIRAVEAVDTCLGRVVAAIETAGGAMLISADHGNAERMSDARSGEPHTAHTMGLVPLVLVGVADAHLVDGRLSDLAPTVLGLMGVAVPGEMTGHTLAIIPEATGAGTSRRANA